MRPIRTARVLAILSLVVALGCGGDDDGADGDGDGDGDGSGGDGGAGNGDDAAPGSADGGGDAPDAGASGPSALGEACSGQGQGTCPDGWECFNLSNGSWCSQRCTTEEGAACQAGYEGPGLPLCLITVTINQDPPFQICGVLCEDDRIGICTPEVCDGTCPAALDCTLEVNSKSGRVGSGCQ